MNTAKAILLVLACVAQTGICPADEGNATELTTDTAERWAQLVLKGVDTEFPNKMSLTYSSPDQIKRPRETFPAFHGCYDWHSSVHGHWVLTRLLRQFPSLPSAPQIREVLARNLSAANLQKEADFFALDEQKTYERMYGWAWLLRLTTELDQWDDPDAKQWRANLRPLENVLVGRTLAYLPKLTFPIRTGQHPDTGFALGQILDYAKSQNLPDLERMATDKAVEFYRSDRDYPVHYEPSGHDFFSSCWNEADLMRRVLPRDQFEAWLAVFLPNLETQLRDETIEPVSVSDVSDPKIVHLAGLNLNRAWCLRAVAESLRSDHPIRQSLLDSATQHLAAGLTYINSGHYEGDHWLATFGLYAIENVGGPQSAKD